MRNRIFFYFFKCQGVSSFFGLIVALRLVRRRRLRRIATPERDTPGGLYSFGVYDLYSELRVYEQKKKAYTKILPKVLWYSQTP